MALNLYELKAAKAKVLEEAKARYAAPVFVDERNRIVKSMEEFLELDLGNLQRLSFSSSFTDPLPELPKFSDLKDLSFHCGISIEQLEKIDLNGVRKLYAVVIPSSDCVFSLVSDTLEELTISFRGEANATTIQCSGLPNLRHMDIRHSKEIHFANAESLTQLESIAIGSGKLSDTTCLRNLQNLCSIYLYNTVIDDFENLLYPPSVKTLSLESSEINHVSDIERLSGLEYLNIYHTTGDIVEHYEAIRNLNIDRLIISELDKYHDYFRDGVPTHEAIYRTNSFMARWRDKDSPLNPYTRKRYAGWTDDQIFEEEFFFFLRITINDIFSSLNPTSYRIKEYDVSIKRWFVQKMEEVYPFYDYSEFYSQIATEEKGYRSCVDTVKADGFNFVSDEGLFRVCYRRKNGKGLNVRMLAMHDFVDKKRNHSQLWNHADRDIKKAISQYLPEYDFDTQELEIVFIDYFGTQSTKKLKIAVVIAAALLHYGIHADTETAFSGELNRKSEISRWPGPHPRLVACADFTKMVLLSTQKKISSNYGSIDIEKYTDLESFARKYMISDIPELSKQ